jgi:hypothetical protein
MEAKLTQHASLRCAQRRVSQQDLELALRIGTATEDGVLVREADVQAQVAQLKRQITSLERLKGVYVACPGEAVVTVYRPSRRREKVILRDGIRRDNRIKIA